MPSSRPANVQTHDQLLLRGEREIKEEALDNITVTVQDCTRLRTVIPPPYRAPLYTVISCRLHTVMAPPYKGTTVHCNVGYLRRELRVRGEQLGELGDRQRALAVQPVLELHSKDTFSDSLIQYGTMGVPKTSRRLSHLHQAAQALETTLVGTYRPQQDEGTVGICARCTKRVVRGRKHDLYECKDNNAIIESFFVNASTKVRAHKQRLCCRSVFWMRGILPKFMAIGGEGP